MLMLSCSIASYGQTDSMVQKNDSINNIALHEYNQILGEVEKLRVADSIKKAELESQLHKLKTTDNLQKVELQQQLKSIEENEKKRIEDKKAHIESLRNTAKGYPVIGAMKDTLFLIYSKKEGCDAFHQKKDKNKKVNLGGPGKRTPRKTESRNRAVERKRAEKKKKR